MFGGQASSEPPRAAGARSSLSIIELLLTKEFRCAPDPKAGQRRRGCEAKQAPGSGALQSATRATALSGLGGGGARAKGDRELPPTVKEAARFAG